MTRSPLSGTKINLVTTLDEAFEFKRWLSERKDFITFDTETSGFNPYEPGARIRLAQIGYLDAGWAIPWEDWRGLVTESLSAWQGDIVLHNSAFDIKWTEEHSDYRFPWAKVHDTMIAAHIIDPLGAGGLKPLGDKYVDRRASAGQHLLEDAMTKQKWTWDTVPVDFPVYWQYGALDTVITAHLHERFRKFCGPGRVYSNVYDLEMAVRSVVSKMEQRGARIDLDYSRQQRDELVEMSARLKEWGMNEHGISLGSPAQLGKWFEEHGAEITVFTTTGRKQVDKHQLKIFSDHENPLVAEVAKSALSMRRATKISSAYFDNFLTFSVPSPDGDLIHPSIKTLGARTGRMSVGQPALQQLPKGDAQVRSAFIPREGNHLLSADFNQIEMRLMACFSEDHDLQQAFLDADATGGDFFVTVGAQVYNDPGFARSDKRRNLIKGTMYGKCYGAGVAKMAETAGVTFDSMSDTVKQLDATFPGMKEFMKRVEHIGVERERAEGQGYIMTPLGRRLPCDEGRVYTLTNYLIQSTAADIFKKALVNLDCAGYGPYLLLPVHDEIVMDIPKEMVPEALVEVPEIMKDTDWPVPMTTDSEAMTTSWGEKYA